MDRVRSQLGLDAWKGEYNGDQVTVAVLDTGIALHPDLSGRVIGFRDFLHGQSDPYDDCGHGTHV